MGGAWVFPGGAVDRSEGEGQAALRAAALRELDEEAGVRLSGPDALVAYSRWITPVQLDASANAPCTRTTVRGVGVDVS